MGARQIHMFAKKTQPASLVWARRRSASTPVSPVISLHKIWSSLSHVVLCFKNKAPMNPQIGQFYMLYYQPIHWVGSIIVTHIQTAMILNKS